MNHHTPYEPDLDEEDETTIMGELRRINDQLYDLRKQMDRFEAFLAKIEREGIKIQN